MNKFKIKQILALILTLAFLHGCAQGGPVTENESLRNTEDSYKVGIMLSKEVDNPLSLDKELIRILDSLKDETGLEYRYIYTHETTNDLEGLKILAESGFNMVFYPGVRDRQEYNKLAALYPDTKFVYLGQVEEMDELVSISIAKDQAAYIAGYLSAATSKTGKVGLLYSIPDPQMAEIEKAFQQGIKAYNLEATKEITWEIQHLYIPEDDPQQPELLRALAFNMKNKGVDIIYHSVGVNSETLLSWAKENQIAHIGSYFTPNVTIEAPEMVQIRFNLSPVVKDLILEDIRGEFLTGPRSYTIKEGILDFRGFHEERIPLELLERVRAIIKGFREI